MNIVIVEDERLTAKDLEEIILDVAPGVHIQAHLSSVRQAVTYLQQNPAPDLFFCDIQLGDGLSFEIFDQVTVSAPIVFCTAYDQYALEAFKLNGIDYVLKPFTSEAIRAALKKYEGYSAHFGASPSLQQIQQLLAQLQVPTLQNPHKPSQLLVHHKERIIPIPWEDIALFFIDQQVTYLYTMDGMRYFYNKTLDQLETICGPHFFRANRQMLINRAAIKDASHHLSRKFSVHLQIPFEEPIRISKEKLPEFLQWLSA
jgi:two-component system response regulator LytT